VDWTPALLAGCRAGNNPAFHDAAIFTLKTPSEITPVALDAADLVAWPQLTAVG